MTTQEFDALVLASLPATPKQLANRLGVGRHRVFNALLRLSGQIHISAEIQDVGRPQNVWSAGAIPVKPREKFKSTQPARTAGRRDRDRRAEAAARRKADLFGALEKIEAMGGTATARQVGDALNRSAGWVSMLAKEAREAELLTGKRKGDAMVYTLLPGWRQAISGERATAADMRVDEIAHLPRADLPLYRTPWQQLPFARMSARAGA